MKHFWYKPLSYDKKFITAAIEAGADAVYVDKEHIEEVRSLAKITVISREKPAELVVGVGVGEVEIEKVSDEAKAVAFGGRIPVIISCKDWTIIPLENLISKTTNLIQTVCSAKEAAVALQTLERGADGVLLVSDDIAEIQKTGAMVRKYGDNEKLALEEAEIAEAVPIGIGSRVCVDTTSNLNPGEGLLCGDASSAFFLVHNENVENIYCDPRPLRVNAGAVHAYVRIPDMRTKYLGELKTGDKVLICDHHGNTRVVSVGRAKIEERPMMMIVARSVQKEDETFTLVVQNAETIRLTSSDGQARSVPKLIKGDRVLMLREKDGRGRHFGTKIEETIKEQ